jgi:hypothetical protein
MKIQSPRAGSGGGAIPISIHLPAIAKSQAVWPLPFWWWSQLLPDA